MRAHHCTARIRHVKPVHGVHKHLALVPKHLALVPMLLAPMLLACSPYRLAPAPSEPGAVTQPFTTYLDGMATVCIIRSAQFALAVTFTVHDNKLLVGATRGPTYFCYRAQPGRHQIAITGDDGQQRFDVLLEPRARYYLDQRLKFDLGDVVSQGDWVDEATAAQLLRRSEHRVLQGAPASERLLTGTEVVATVPATP
ncbi:MAG: hypothetical protein H0T76_08060 [Nannocystis sp.]|nr:hypothetical protein [Nannocystis sp.]MBA3546419.1 hypothetical protein [Nannocystis sp.]